MRTIIYFTWVAFLSALLSASEIFVQSWTNLGSGIDGTVSALACDTNGNLYAGGMFANAGGISALS